MSDREILLHDLNKLHTTQMGTDRIRKNLGLSSERDPVGFCREIITAEGCGIYRRGKIFYCTAKGVIVTVNAYSFTIITAHKV